MLSLNEQISRFENIANNPKAQLEKALVEGKKCIGVMPCFAPEELAYALGFMPFGLWGAQRQVTESRRYYPSFVCSILHTILDLGITGAYNGLSAIMVPMICDAMKGMGANWTYGVPTIPVINVPIAQNRKISAGIEFNKVKAEKILLELEELAGKKVATEDIKQAIAVYNENRAACMEFVRLAGKHPEAVSCMQRSKVLKARYFMDRAEHTAWIRGLNNQLAGLPDTSWNGKKIVTTGIIADIPEFLEILDKNKMAIAADQILHESVDNMYLVPETEDPVEGLAIRLANIEGTSVLFDPTKQRAKELVKLAKDKNADGVLWVGTKFCDPEEFDLVPAKKLLKENDISVLAIELDEQMEGFGQIKTAIETFIDMI